MQIQTLPQGGVPRRLQLNTPQPPSPPPLPPGGHQHHGLSGTLLHVGHDAAMLAMTPPTGQHNHAGMEMDMGPICHGGGNAPDPHAGHSMHHTEPSSSNWLATGSAVLSGAVAVGAAVHGVQMITSKDRFTQLEGANHLLMSASCGVMSAAMLAPQSGLGTYTSPLMAAHGLGEMALGAYQLVRGTRQDCQHDRLAGALKIAHGGCLTAAQFFPGAAFPLYLGMAAATASQICLQQAGLSH